MMGVSSDRFEPRKRKYYRVLLGGALSLVMGGVLFIPFVYETQTLWYKVGGDKILLRTGQMVGLATVVLLFVQILVGARGQFLQQLYSLAALMRWHRFNGVVVSFLAIGHMFLILIPEGLTNLPIGIKYWPEIVGILLLGIILIMVISAQWRQQLHLDYRRWRIFHKFSAYLIPPLVTLHVLFVSESFEHTVPRMALFIALAGVVLVMVVSKKAALP